MSFGMFMPRAFWMAIFSRELESGLGPPAFTAMAISLPMRVKSLLSLALRAKILCLRFSKMRPMVRWFEEGPAGSGGAVKIRRPGRTAGPQSEAARSGATLRWSPLRLPGPTPRSAMPSGREVR